MGGLSGWQVYLLWLAAASFITFILYGYDKLQARRSGWRIPENTLLLLALVGGFPGGWLGRWLFRHKTRKGVFLFVLIIGTLLHAGLVYFLFFR